VEKGIIMAVKTLELNGNSTSSIKEAIDNALEKAHGREYERFEILETHGSQQDEHSKQYQATIKLFL
jgi:flavin-binding protein dodecin